MGSRIPPLAELEMNLGKGKLNFLSYEKLNFKKYVHIQRFIGTPVMKVPTIVVVPFFYQKYLETKLNKFISMKKQDSEQLSNLKAVLEENS